MIFFFSSRRRHTRSKRDWSSDVCSSDLSLRSGSTRLGSERNGDSALGWAADGDRKSTRLNSSHVSHSYAVFCLKKKKDCGQRGAKRVAPLGADDIQVKDKHT